MSLREHLTLNREEKRVDEEILNVIRESNAGFVGTTEVSDSPGVDREEDTVRNRLWGLEEEGRVHVKRIGNDGNLAWYLSEDERQDPVNPDIYWAARICEEGRGVGTVVLRIGVLCALTGFLLMMLALTADIAGVQLEIVSAVGAAYLGYIVAGAGAVNVFVGGGIKWGVSIMENVIERRAEVNMDTSSG
ncbi:hypothetical protein KVP04_00505 [Halobacterium salinarum]|jgi:hypothetical protein|uniref:hypothetical protein n=1 Tax=Halobacterium salinarum TaxID=2242 RepID=UPI001F2849E3|nr:hypothetical protein [Halobacterium salinarum]MCF2165369.1 hypothetical protein [Halobacterium salinarum]MCF2168228.1 hypothetical protein [Halobacterium salinarum]MCF2237617.1 hypothetical protein [Halobacterium salinarum]